jgi:arginase family enzyme
VGPRGVRRIATFAARPCQQDPSGPDVAVVGVPYDSATSFRSGARFGPRGIRVASQALRPYNSSRSSVASPAWTSSGMDMVEVAPPFDHAEITSLLAANLVYEALSVLALAKQGGR